MGKSNNLRVYICWSWRDVGGNKQYKNRGNFEGKNYECVNFLSCHAECSHMDTTENHITGASLTTYGANMFQEIHCRPWRPVRKCK